MFRLNLAIVLLVQAVALAGGAPVRAEDAPAQSAESSQEAGAPAPVPQPAPAARTQDIPAPVPVAPAPQPAAAPATDAGPALPNAPAAAEAAAPAAPADPVVAIIRTKLGDGSLTKDANGDDVSALAAFYASRSGAPLWITEMGVNAKGQEAIFEIEKAGDWGLDAAVFDLPPAAEIPASPEAQAVAEIKLGLAVLKYARYARGGRLTPLQVSELYDQAPPVRDPRAVLTEIETADDPGAYLVSLQPKHAEFLRLRDVLLAARGKPVAKDSPAAKEEKGDDEAKDEKPDSKEVKDDNNKEPAKTALSERDIKRILLNMERWRWMPEELGSVYVWNNSPEFMLYVIKDGKRIYADKILVGTSNYATPVFDDEMETIVFNPDWIAPETVVKENLLPHLRAGNYSILKVHKLSVSYNGSPVNASKVDWGRVNVLNYTFLQKGGPGNNLGKIKFLFPNKHVVYMHDTLPVRKKYFKEKVRMIGHECVRMEKPLEFAEVLLAEGNGMPAAKVKELWDTGMNVGVTLQRKIPVHMVYFTAVADENGKVSTFADAYGLDRKLAAALFKDATGFPEPVPDKSTAAVVSDSRPANRAGGGGGGGIAGSIGFIDD